MTVTFTGARLAGDQLLHTALLALADQSLSLRRNLVRVLAVIGSGRVVPFPMPEKTGLMCAGRTQKSRRPRLVSGTVHGLPEANTKAMLFSVLQNS